MWKEGKNICGYGDFDEVLNIDLTIKHTGTTAVVVMTSTLDEGTDNVKSHNLSLGIMGYQRFLDIGWKVSWWLFSMLIRRILRTM